MVTTADDELDPTYDPNDLSLREAIALANANPGPDTISFDPSLDGSTITLGLGELAITDSVTIQGPGAANLTIDADGQSRIFNVNDGNSSTNINVEIDGLTLTGGSADQMAAPSFRENLTLQDSLITGNTANGYGGGNLTRLIGGTTTIQNSTISGNNADQGEGGGFVSQLFRRSRPSRTAPFPETRRRQGGGIVLREPSRRHDDHPGQHHFRKPSRPLWRRRLASNSSYGTTTIQNSTISGNSASYGGGLATRYNGTTIRNSTVTSNAAYQSGSTAYSGGGGLAVAYGATITIQSDIIAANHTDGFGPDIVGSIAASYSLIGDDTGATLTDNGNNLIGDPNGTGIIDPMLGLLADNGGPTWTCALLPGSPAINAGSNPDGLQYDQRGPGFDRVVGAAADIGAFECVGDTTPPVATANFSSLVVSDFRATFDVVYTDDVAVDVSTINQDQAILVAGPNGYSQYATLIGMTPGTDGPSVTATYQITSPGAAWSDAEGGLYTATIEAGKVSDTSGNFVPGGALGSFAVPTVGNLAGFALAGAISSLSEQGSSTAKACGSGRRRKRLCRRRLFWNRRFRPRAGRSQPCCRQQRQSVRGEVLGDGRLHLGEHAGGYVW